MRFKASDELVEQFHRDGAAYLPGLFDPGEIEALRAGIDLNLERLSPRAKVASAAGDPGKFVEDFCTWQDNPHYRRFIFDSALAETAGRLMRSTCARLYHDHLLTKEPATRQPTPWHQDQPYYNIDGAQNVSSSRARIWVRGSCRAASWSARRNGFRRARSPICRTSRSGARIFAFSAGS